MRNLMGLPCSGNSSTTCSIQDTFATLSRKHNMLDHYDKVMPATNNYWATVPKGIDSIADAKLQRKGIAKSTLVFLDETDDDSTIML